MNQDITIANKLWRYKFKRSNEKVQINLVIKRNKKIKIVLCFCVSSSRVRESSRERDRQTETDRQRQSDRDRQTETDRQRQRQTETDRERQRETEIIEDLLEDNLSSDGWYLTPQYFITEMEVPFFKLTI